MTFRKLEGFGKGDVSGVEPNAKHQKKTSDEGAWKFHLEQGDSRARGEMNGGLWLGC